jgi:hypothetical protein
MSLRKSKRLTVDLPGGGNATLAGHTGMASLLHLTGLYGDFFKKKGISEVSEFTPELRSEFFQPFGIDYLSPSGENQVGRFPGFGANPWSAQNAWQSANPNSTGAGLMGQGINHAVTNLLNQRHPSSGGMAGGPSPNAGAPAIAQTGFLGSFRPR